MNKIIENILFIIVGTVILIPIIFKFIKLPELFMILLAFIGLALVLNGAFNLIYILWPRIFKNQKVQ